MVSTGSVLVGPQKVGYQRTINSTITILATATIPDIVAVIVNVDVIGQHPTDHIHHCSKHVVKRSGVNATYIGQISSDSNSSGAGTWTITTDCSGTNVFVYVTGQAAHTIDWTCKISFDICASYEFTPLDLSPAAWWRSDQGVLVTSNKVYEWQDISGNGHSIIQSNNALRPTLDSSGTYPKLVLASAANSSLYEAIGTASIDLSAGYTVIFIGKDNSVVATDWQMWFHIGVSDIAKHFFIAANGLPNILYLGQYTGGYNSWTITAGNHCFIHDQDNTNTRTRIDAGAWIVAPGSTLGASGARRCGIGNASGAGGDTGPDIDVYEAMIFTPKINDTSIDLLRSYCNARYGT